MKSFALVGLFLLGLPWSTQESYKPVEVRSADDAYVPYQVVIDGLFVLDVSLDENGEISRINALRDPGSMLGAAKNSVRSWKFQPASRDSRPEPSRMTVSFIYRPPNYGNAGAVPPKDFTPVIPADNTDSRGHGGYVPAGIESFAYPDYPANSVAWGSVVVQLTLDASGEVKNIDFLHGMENFNKLISDALKKWRFRAATFEGKPIASKTVIAFIFQTPSSN